MLTCGFRRGAKVVTLLAVLGVLGAVIAPAAMAAGRPDTWTHPGSGGAPMVVRNVYYFDD